MDSSSASSLTSGAAPADRNSPTHVQDGKVGLHQEVGSCVDILGSGAAFAPVNQVILQGCLGAFSPQDILGHFQNHRSGRARSAGR